MIITHDAPVGAPDLPGLSRSETLRYRLRYAELGVRTSPADTAKKKPLLKGWQRKATTNPQQITAECNRWPQAGILTPTGNEGRRWVLDVDALEDLYRLERELGTPLRGISTEVRTQSGHLQIHFRYPEGAEIRGSVGKNLADGFANLDVRGDGNLVLLPPSAGYSFANALPMAQAPPGLVEWACSRKKAAPVPSAARSGRGGSKFVGGIHEGGRHAALISHLGRYHDGTRTLGDLIEEAHRFNADCVPPEDARRVERDARSVYGMAPCRRRRHADPRAEAVLEAWSDHFYDERLPRGGRSKTFDVANYLLISAGKSGEFYEGEEGTGVVFSDSIRGIESKARTTKTSVGRATQLMREEGFLKMLKRGCGDQASTWLLIVPPRARTSGTFLNDLPSPLVGQGQKGGRAGGNVPLVRGDRLRTLFWRWGSLIGTGGRVVLVALEAFGPQTAEELAELVGISRTRDLVSRRLVSLEELGLIERDGERWRLAEGHMEAQSRLEGEEYATGGERKERRHTNEGRTPRGRRVTSVGDTSYYASELKRDRDTRERQKKERAEYQKMLREIEEAQRANEERRSMLRRMRLAETVRLLSDGAIVEADGHIGELRKAPQP